MIPKFIYRAIETNTGEWVTGQLHFKDGKPMIIELTDISKIHLVERDKVRLALYNRFGWFNNPNKKYLTEGDIIRVHKRNGKTFVTQIEYRSGGFYVYGSAYLLGLMNSICYVDKQDESKQEPDYYTHIPLELLLKLSDKIEYLGFEFRVSVDVVNKYQTEDEKYWDNYTFIFGDMVDGQTRHSIVQEISREINCSPENDFASPEHQKEHDEYLEKLTEKLSKI